MGLVVKDGELGSLCRPYRRNWGQSPNSEILRTVPKFSLAPLRGSGGEWLAGEGRSESDRIRHLRCLPPSGPCGRTSVRPYNPRKLRAYGPCLGYDRRLVQGSGGGAAGPQAKACGSVGANETSLGVRSVTRAMILEKAHV